MTVEMGADLVLGFRDEAKAPLVAENAADGTDREGSGVPERGEAAGFFA